MNYNKLLLDELRFVTYEKRNSELTDELLAKAVTLNENLQALGYMLAPSDIASIHVLCKAVLYLRSGQEIPCQAKTL